MILYVFDYPLESIRKLRRLVFIHFDSKRFVHFVLQGLDIILVRAVNIRVQVFENHPVVVQDGIEHPVIYLYQQWRDAFAAIHLVTSSVTKLVKYEQ